MQELEACLAVLGGDRARLCSDLASAAELTGLVVGSPERRELVDTYYDSPDGRLVAADMALRSRRQAVAGAWRELLTWKGPGTSLGASGTARSELEGSATEELLGELLDAVRAGGVQWSEGEALPSSAGDPAGGPAAWFAKAGLVPVQSRATERTALMLSADGRGPVCELAIDQVTYELAAHRVVHRELELEAVGATELVEVEALAAQLASEHPSSLRPWPWSKTALGRALEVLEGAGELRALLSGEELDRAGYDRVEAVLRGDRS